MRPCPFALAFFAHHSTYSCIAPSTACQSSNRAKVQYWQRKELCTAPSSMRRDFLYDANRRCAFLCGHLTAALAIFDRGRIGRRHTSLLSPVNLLSVSFLLFPSSFFFAPFFAPSSSLIFQPFRPPVLFFCCPSPCTPPPITMLRAPCIHLSLFDNPAHLISEKHCQLILHERCRVARSPTTRARRFSTC